MAKYPELIQTAEQVIEVAAALRKEKVIAFDTEFIRESTFFPVVEIIQVATLTDSWLIDAQAFLSKKGANRNLSGPSSQVSPALKPILDIFEDPAILKIVHAAQGDQECMYTSFGVVAKPSLDTAVAASLVGLGDGVGLGNLLKAVLQVNIKKGHARTNWAQRPLPAQLIEYAHADVEHLVQLGLTLMERLDKLGRKDWALELTSKWEDAKLYQADPEGIAERLSRGGKLDQKGYAVLIELIRWREERVRTLNLPRRWVADDPVMVDLAQVRPKDLNHLSSFRGLSKGELKNNGEALLEAIQRGESQASGLEPPKRNQKLELPNESESQVLNLLQTYVSILADEQQIAVKHLVTSAQLLPLFRSQASTPDDWVKAGILSAGAARLVGAEILAMLQGKRVLSVAPKGRSLAVQVTQKA